MKPFPDSDRFTSVKRFTQNRKMNKSTPKPQNPDHIKEVHRLLFDTDCPIMLCFSGGKDSVVMALYLMEIGVDMSRVQVHHHDTDGGGPQVFEWSCTHSYVEAFCDHFGLPLYISMREGGIMREVLRKNEGLQDVLIQKNPGEEFTRLKSRKSNTTRMMWPAVSMNLSTRWCSSVAKISVMERLITNTISEGDVLILTGERRTESNKRSTYLEAEPHRTHTKTRNAWTWRPVIDWTLDEVWDKMGEWKIQPHPAYELGWGRCSCQLCIFGGNDAWASVNHISPQLVDYIETKEQEISHTLYKGRGIRSKVEGGTSWISEEMMERWGKEATTQFTSPIIVEGEWNRPQGWDNTHSCGAGGGCGVTPPSSDQEIPSSETPLRVVDLIEQPQQSDNSNSNSDTQKQSVMNIKSSFRQTQILTLQRETFLPYPKVTHTVLSTKGFPLVSTGSKTGKTYEVIVGWSDKIFKKYGTPELFWKDKQTHESIRQSVGNKTPLWIALIPQERDIQDPEDPAEITRQFPGVKLHTHTITGKWEEDRIHTVRNDQGNIISQDSKVGDWEVLQGWNGCSCPKRFHTLTQFWGDQRTLDMLQNHHQDGEMWVSFLRDPEETENPKTQEEDLPKNGEGETPKIQEEKNALFSPTDVGFMAKSRILGHTQKQSVMNISSIKSQFPQVQIVTLTRTTTPSGTTVHSYEVNGQKVKNTSKSGRQYEIILGSDFRGTWKNHFRFGRPDLFWKKDLSFINEKPGEYVIAVLGYEEEETTEEVQEVVEEQVQDVQEETPETPVMESPKFINPQGIKMEEIQEIVDHYQIPTTAKKVFPLVMEINLWMYDNPSQLDPKHLTTEQESVKLEKFLPPSPADFPGFSDVWNSDKPKKERILICLHDLGISVRDLSLLTGTNTGYIRQTKRGDHKVNTIKFSRYQRDITVEVKYYGGVSERFHEILRDLYLGNVLDQDVSVESVEEMFQIMIYSCYQTGTLRIKKHTLTVEIPVRPHTQSERQIPDLSDVPCC